jgi:hypothetical protein
VRRKTYGTLAWNLQKLTVEAGVSVPLFPAGMRPEKRENFLRTTVLKICYSGIRSNPLFPED